MNASAILPTVSPAPARGVGASEARAQRGAAPLRERQTWNLLPQPSSTGYHLHTLGFHHFPYVSGVFILPVRVLIWGPDQGFPLFACASQASFQRFPRLFFRLRLLRSWGWFFLCGEPVCFDVGGAQDAAQTLTGMGCAHANSFPSFVPAAQPAADTAAGSAAGEAPGPAGESQGGYATQEGASQGATEAVDSVRLAAARTIVPGCGLALAGWKPAAAKPRRVEIRLRCLL